MLAGGKLIRVPTIALIMLTIPLGAADAYELAVRERV